MHMTTRISPIAAVALLANMSIQRAQVVCSEQASAWLAENARRPTHRTRSAVLFWASMAQEYDEQAKSLLTVEHVDTPARSPRWARRMLGMPRRG
jgi:hypothetical protein